MKSLDVKEYLKQIEYLDTEIEIKCCERQRFFELATDTTAPYDAERVSSSSNPQRLADIGGELAELNREISTLENSRKRIISKIKSVSDPLERAVLYDHYVRRKKLKRIAKERHFSYAYIVELHKKAVRSVEKNLTKPNKS